ncbi:M15 family metallopeptidase [Pseudofulvibacter geojedonensis]|uniref:D-alanyl-D-alanine dipeptidase n=1 Tax=Pseudofulvibacter geojedonensis TaxID=1123758 RepID=A0ABW3HYV9_9FLAO
MKYILALIVFGSIVLFSCKEKKKITPKEIQENLVETNDVAKEQVESGVGQKDSPASLNVQLYSKEEIESFKDSTFVILKKLDTTFLYSMKYATKDNFLKEQVYDCDDCLVRYKTAKQLIKANNEFKKAGLRILFFDCYRPLYVQKKMWKIYPDKRYVADPSKGSNHNRGTAIDITLADLKNDTLAMGTPFDYFGKKAHHAYLNLPDSILNNRKKLKSTMEKHGFWSITSEWWHYNLSQSYKYPVSNFKTTCD